MQISSQSFDRFSLPCRIVGLPSITGINVKAAFSRSQTPVRTTLTNFPRFICSRTLKRRHSLHRRSEETSQSQAALLPTKLIDREMGASLVQRLLEKKSTPADLIRIEKLQKKSEVTVTESRDESVSKWLAQRKASQGISLKQKGKKMKIVVSLPKAKHKDGLSDLLGGTKAEPRHALLRMSEGSSLNWTKSFLLQAWDHESRQIDPQKRFSKLALG